MNYLRPDITRGDFTEAEIDLMTRLHRLLGNRWSLIAGRIPGRTANDIKNFWNTRMDKKSGGDQKGQPIQKTITKTNIIRPRPHIFTNSMIQEGQVIGLVADHENESNNPNNDDDDDKLQRSSSIIGSLPSSSQEADKCIHWWSNLLDATDNKLETSIMFLDDEGKEAGFGTGQTNPTGLVNELKTHDFDFEV
ncbi:uncharacterized protein [Henckelia pumila]|uniref:uncharacterized protein n=1 Tax=Henckelia pumila TaxID=405737 RepID=UPI003C6E1B9A